MTADIAVNGEAPVEAAPTRRAPLRRAGKIPRTAGRKRAKAAPKAPRTEAANGNMLSEIKNACESDVAAAQYRVSYNYLYGQLAAQSQVRSAMEKDFADAIGALKALPPGHTSDP